MMAYRRKSILRIIREMEGKYGRYFYERQDLKVPNTNIDVTQFKEIKSLLGKEVVEVKDYDGVKLIASDGSWLMFRGSGTEPIMRVYAESKSLAESRRLIRLGKRLVLRLAR
jgi:phosphomannomutase